MDYTLTRGLAACLALSMSLSGAALAQSGIEDGIDALARQIVARSSSSASDQTTIAISSFPHVDDTCSELSNFLVDELVLSLFSIPDGNLQIIERSQLSRIFAELELSMSGAVDANTTQELGRIHGVDTLLVGSLTTLGDDLRVNSRLINTETGQVFSAAAVNIPKTSTIETLMQRPSASGCTMTPSGAQRGGGGQAQSSGGTSVSLSAGTLESFDQLLGEWYGMLECEGNTQQIWFLANRALSNGVSGFFRLSSFRGWDLQDKLGTERAYSTTSGPGSASLTLRPSGEGNEVAFNMSAKHHDYNDTYEITLAGSNALYGTARSENCGDVNLGKVQASDAD
ncbi:FlgO family outer membrane protein [Halomonas cerina]|uniref:TolB-like protein n=1 Tax=Halomonas cerina TaxID=447424 RepID=A0A839VE91_9GAMM|nr:FlgO family outer membrane protein [Halomonas cerina]MBB3192405.1 TolB-like protein [Halomonas cerina]